MVWANRPAGYCPARGLDIPVIRVRALIHHNDAGKRHVALIRIHARIEPYLCTRIHLAYVTGQILVITEAGRAARRLIEEDASDAIPAPVVADIGLRRRCGLLAVARSDIPEHRDSGGPRAADGGLEARLRGIAGSRARDIEDHDGRRMGAADRLVPAARRGKVGRDERQLTRPAARRYQPHGHYCRRHGQHEGSCYQARALPPASPWRPPAPSWRPLAGLAAAGRDAVLRGAYGPVHGASLARPQAGRRSYGLPPPSSVT